MALVWWCRAMRGIVNGSTQLVLADFRRLCALEERNVRYIPGDRMLRPGQTLHDFWAETDVAHVR